MRIIFIDKTLAIRTQLLFFASVNNTLQFVKDDKLRFAKGAKYSSLKRYDAVSKKDKAGQQEVKRKRAKELSRYELKS